MNDFYGYSEADIVREMGRRFRIHRQLMRLRQADVAAQAGVSLQTIRRFESGAAVNITLATFGKLLGAIGQRRNLDAALPEIPSMSDFFDKPVQRVKSRRHGQKA
jgi:transcriptional regulator with XRE-family HTH domain